jgi:hypothetical protein
VAKPKFASLQWFFFKVNGLLKNLILIRICSRYPKQQILAKQCLVGISSDTFAFSGYLAMLAVTSFSMATVCFFGLGLSPNSLKSFYIFLQPFYFKKTRLSKALK